MAYKRPNELFIAADFVQKPFERKPMEPGQLFVPVINTERGARVPESSEQTIRRIKENFFRGDYGEPAGQAIVELLQLAENPVTYVDERIPGEVDALKDTIRRIDARYEALRQAFPPPKCGNCSSEMSLENHGNMDFYVCDCHRGGCTCFQGHAPCSWCMHIVIADDWMLEHSAEERCEWEENHKATAGRLCEEGPSAAAAAKPVTKLVITCQGDWSPWEENL